MLCNESLNRTLTDKELKTKTNQIIKAVESIYGALEIDYKNDPNSRDTPKRIAKMFLQETLEGLYSELPTLTDFDNAKYDQLIVTGPIEVKSLCAHHWQPITGVAYIGVLPNKKVLGLSKFTRVVRHFSRRFQIQEELTEQIAKCLMDVLKPKGIAVRIIAKHHCVSHRGVNEHGSSMDTIAVYGLLRNSSSLKSEFLASCDHLHKVL